MSSVAKVLRKDKVNAKGECPIHFRIIKDRKTRYISTSVYLKEGLWDAKKQEVSKKHPNSTRLNNLLAKRFSELYDKVIELETKNKEISSKQLKTEIYGRKPNLFFDVAATVLEGYRIDNKPNSYHRNSSVIRLFKEFIGNDSIALSDITIEILDQYSAYLKTERGNSANTVHANLKFLRRVFNEALRRSLIEPNQNPFLRYRLKTEKTTKEYLTEQELEFFNAVELDEKSKMAIHRDLFVFACYTGGIRISDLLKMRWRDYDGERLKFIVKKTKKQHNVKIPDFAKEIIIKYKSNENTPNDFLFPILKPSTNTEDNWELDKAISGATAYINKNLKLISERAGINKRISFHASRHTWATRAIRKGMQFQNVSKLLDHAHFKETQIYVKIVNEELDKAMDIFNK